jgi:AcrR family transcriptional regulator
LDGAETGTRRKRLKHDERRQKIIETTLTCLARDGAEGTSLRSVCREMGVAPSLVTHFFDGWHDLLVAAYDLLVEGFMSTLAPVIQASYPSARSRMDAVIQEKVRSEPVSPSGSCLAACRTSRPRSHATCRVAAVCCSKGWRR